MQKLKLVFCAILIFVLLCGCGKTYVNSTQRDSEEYAFSVSDIDTLKSQGYSKVGSILYAKIENSEEGPLIYLNYYENAPELAIYAMEQFANKLDGTMNFVITWNGQEYDLRKAQEANSGDDLEEFLRFFPKDWRVCLENSIGDNNSIDDYVSVSNAKSIDEDVAAIVSDYLEKGEIEVITSNDYEVDKEILHLSILKQGSQMRFSIEGKAKTEEKAYLMFGVLVAELQNLKEEFYECSANIRYDNLYVLYLQYTGTTVLSGVNKDGTFAMGIPDWLNKSLDNFCMTNESKENYVIELESAIKNFGKEAGYKMGVLLE